MKEQTCKAKSSENRLFFVTTIASVTSPRRLLSTFWKIQLRPLAMVLSSSLIVGPRCSFSSLEEAKIDPPMFVSDGGIPSSMGLKHSLESTGAIPMNSSISKISAMPALSEVLSPVVKSISISVINNKSPASFHHHPMHQNLSWTMLGPDAPRRATIEVLPPKSRQSLVIPCINNRMLPLAIAKRNLFAHLISSS